MLRLCKSSCSTTCDEAPFIKLAKAGEDVNPSDPSMSSLFPEDGPICVVNLTIAATAG
jgi:hypothetical protein